MVRARRGRRSHRVVRYNVAKVRRHRVGIAITMATMLRVMMVLSWRLEQAEGKQNWVSVGVCGGLGVDRPPLLLRAPGE